ncbi:MAG TPA: hypothetical protein VFG09_14240 [Thermodesulfovibrionales bacterium]|jgi:hypothetical protein|nr:hypothetical protein [Thermodesulfovibrionales bacterium]
MDKAKTKVVISILKDSSLYDSLPHEEKIALLLRLEKDYPFLFRAGHEGKVELNTV